MRGVEHKVMISILAAIAISLVVNFAYLMVTYTQSLPLDQLYAEAEAITPSEGFYEGIYHSSRWGYGLLITKSRDTVYIPYVKARKIFANDGDTLRVAATINKLGNISTPVADRALRRNGTNIINESAVIKRKYIEAALQMVYFFLLSLITITITTIEWRGKMGWIVCSGVAIVVGMALYPICPVVLGRSASLSILLYALDPYSYVAILKWAFVIGTSILYSWIYILLTRQQSIRLENERLENENITTRYNMLMSQINPHFFFNSLNSLSLLVREGDQQRGLKYIDQLSYTFRYNIQNGEGQMTSLSEEMRFAEAYIYLFKIRYADKLFFDIDIDAQMMSYMLPAMSLQPLLDNAVKHNTITKLKPLHISIRTQGDVLIVENPKRPKIEKDPSTGIGLDNLNKRWQLITGGGVKIEDDNETFAVKMKLKPMSDESSNN